jgi:predicted ArsR family transcriptional regulator
MSSTSARGGASNADVLKFFREAPRPFQTASDVAEEFGVERQTAHRWLQNLHDAGDLEKEKVGARAVVWWLANNDAAPAEPLRQLVGIATEDEADSIRERSEEWRKEFNEEMAADDETATR